MKATAKTDSPLIRSLLEAAREYDPQAATWLQVAEREAVPLMAAYGPLPDIFTTDGSEEWGRAIARMVAKVEPAHTETKVGQVFDDSNAEKSACDDACFNHAAANRRAGYYLGLVVGAHWIGGAR